MGDARRSISGEHELEEDEDDTDDVCDMDHGIDEDNLHPNDVRATALLLASSVGQRLNEVSALPGGNALPGVSTQTRSTLDATIREAHRKSCTTLHGGQVVHNRGRGWNLQADDSDELEKPTWA
jgi:hypothetical protein